MIHRKVTSWLHIAILAAVVVLVAVAVHKAKPTPVVQTYPPMCFVIGATDITDHAPATWIERHGLKNLVQKFVMFECLDGKQFVVPFVKQGGSEIRDTR